MIVRAAACRDPESVLRHVNAEEVEYRQKTLYGEEHRAFGCPDCHQRRYGRRRRQPPVPAYTGSVGTTA